MKLTRLEIRHLPGIDSPFAVDFAPDTVNLVTGPNGSGKSSLVRAVRALISPGRGDPHIELSARWQDDNGELRCERSGPVVQWRRGDEIVPAPRLPGPEAVGAYLISSEDLSAPGQTEAHIAGHIQTLLAGGYDLDAVITVEPFKTPSRPQKLAGDINSTQRAIAAKEAEYAALQEQIENLQQLEAELRRATRSASLLRTIDDAIALADAHSSRTALEATLIEEFPGGMDRLHGDELERLEQTRAALEQKQQAINIEQEALAHDRAQLEQSGAEDPEELEAMQARLADARDALAATEQALSTSDEQIEAAEQALSRAARRLGSAQPDQVDQLDQPALETLERQVEKVLGLREKMRALTGQLALAQVSRNPTGRPQSDLLSGRNALKDWLALARLNPLEGVLWGSLALAAVLGSWRVLTTQSPSSNPELLLLVVLAAGLPLAMLIRFARRWGQREHSRRRFLATAIEPPLGWAENEVENRLERLEAELEAARQHEVSQARAGELRDQLNAQRATLERSREKLKKQADDLGISADPRLETGFLLWCRHLQDWQREQQRLDEQRLRKAHLQARLERQTNEVSQLLQQYALEPEEISSRALAHRVHQLQPRIRRLSELQGSIQARRRRVQELQGDVAQLRQQISQLFETVGLADGEIASLRQKIELFPSWQAMEQQRREFSQQISLLEQRLADHEDLVDQARHQRLLELQALRDEHEQRAEQRDGLNRQITEIRTRHAEVLKRRDLEQLVNEFEQQRESLIEELDGQMIAAAGQHLIEEIRSDFRTEHEPQLLAAADRWLDSFTRHRYRLRFENHSFQAIDTRSGRRLALTELSSGGRAQFMLAVRLAWIEQQEQHSQVLPVFMDEVLTTSDADRYRAVVGAVRALIDNGRQLFYLTAQSDDAQAWWAWLGDGLQPHAIDMAEVRRGEVPELEFGMPESARAAAALPDPDEVSPQAWFRAAGVEAIDPWQDSGRVHIAYLLSDNLRQAHRLLGLGVERLGELERLIERCRQQGANAEAPEFAAIVRLQPRVRATRRWLDDWRRRHPRPVGLAELVASGLITERFLPQVEELAAEVGADPVALIERLRAGAVPRFRSDVAEQLCDWLKGEGYWPDEESDPGLTAADLMLETGLTAAESQRLVDALNQGIVDPLGANEPREQASSP